MVKNAKLPNSMAVKPLHLTGGTLPKRLLPKKQQSPYFGLMASLTSVNNGQVSFKTFFLKNNKYIQTLEKIRYRIIIPEFYVIQIIKYGRSVVIG